MIYTHNKPMWIRVRWCQDHFLRRHFSTRPVDGINGPELMLISKYIVDVLFDRSVDPRSVPLIMPEPPLSVVGCRAVWTRIKKITPTVSPVPPQPVVTQVPENVRTLFGGVRCEKSEYLWYA